MKDLYNRIKNSAKQRGIEFSLTLGDLHDLTIPITCPVLGIPLKKNRGRQSDNSISVDRIDSNKGYSKDNIIIVSWRANFLKSNSSLDEMKKLVIFYEELEESRNDKA